MECSTRFLRAAHRLGLLPEVFFRTQTIDAVALLHSFVRGLDDLVDEMGPGAAAGLDRVAEELTGRAAPRPLVGALLRCVPDLPRDALMAFLEGLRGDVGGVRFADDPALIRYAYRVSSTVGLMLCHVLGVHRPRAQARAVDLGIALQISDIVRDVEEDARRGRVYLPVSRLAAAGVDARRLIESRAPTKAVREVLGGLTGLADRYYESAWEGLRDVPWRYRHGVLLLARYCRELGLRAAREWPRVAAVPTWRRAMLVAELVPLALTPRLLGLGRPEGHDRLLHTPVAGLPGTVGP